MQLQIAPSILSADFAELGKTNLFYRDLARICEKSNGLWSKEAEEYLLARAPSIEIGEPSAVVKERRIVL